MDDETNKNSSVNKSFEIDQRAIKVFLDWVPDNWLPRKQDPDFFVDYLVEIVAQGEPMGLHFAAQVKGFEDQPNAQKSLSYSFKTKHLKYYLNRSQHPVFLFLINISTREGFWLFAQKHLKEKVAPKILDEQQSVTVHFFTEDNLENSTKFKCLLSEAERYVRDLHPGSIQAALQKRKSELEAKDPRCSVAISIKDGKEQITIVPKETFSFQTKIRSKNVRGWQDFFERGAEVKVEAGEMEIIGAPLLEEVNKAIGGYSKIQFGTPHSGCIQIFCGSGENLTIVQVDGQIRAGTKFMTFRGAMPDSPLEINGEVALHQDFKKEISSSHLIFSLDKWNGQSVLLLSFFDQIEILVKALCASAVPKMQILVRGNILWTGVLGDFEAKAMHNISYMIEWLRKCRWLAQHFSINPIMTPLQDVSDENWDAIFECYDLLQTKNVVIPAPELTISFSSGNPPPPENALSGGDGVLRIEKPEIVFQIFGQPVRIGPIRYEFTEMRNVTFSPSEQGGTNFVFTGNSETKRIVTLLT